jgi:CheY-like chemotaxis protein
MHQARILVVDNDPWIQRMVAAVLGHRGHVVECVDGAAQARATLMRGQPPSLVIVARTLPDGRGEALVGSLRRAGQLNGVAALLLADPTADPAEPPPSHPEMDGVLSKPLRVEDLENAVARALAAIAGRRKGPPPLPVQAPPPLPAPSLEGELGAIGLSTVMLLLEMERKTGALHLSGGDKRTAELIFRKGRVIRAHVFEGDATLAGAEAVYRTLAWSDGWFSFHPVGIEGPDEIQATTAFLLMEGASRMDAAAKRDADPGEEVDI